MVSCTLHLRQDLGEWVLKVVVTEDYQGTAEPLQGTAVWRAPLTATEWDGDVLSAVLSALHRWVEMTMAMGALADLD
jgi:hypothetical protein